MDHLDLMRTSPSFSGGKRDGDVCINREHG